MAEFDIGKHCSMESCKQLDFLPVECDKCGLIFCKIHYAYVAHNCKVYTQACSEAALKIEKIRYNCSTSGCDKSELVAVVCPFCKLNFCLQHRHPQDHDCQHVDDKKHKMIKTSQLVDNILKNAEKASQSGKKPIKNMSAKAKATAARVSLMRIKQKAVGDEGLPQEQRIYLRIQHPPLSELCIFLDKEWSVGKSIDVIADKLKVENKNNMAHCKVLCLFNDAGTCLETSSRWTHLLNEETIFSGSELTLSLT